ncbi:hypothetical protein [Herbiconiux sp. UC225_62]|uniref:hypothetical protein n=1 Tax=Herbiconiux sp. UC225_62 TaxID=3350168 RepID=UPI0036D2AAE3
MGNYIAGTASQRTSFTHPDWPDLGDPWEGLFWQETDGNRSGYLYTGGGWVFVSMPRQTAVGLSYLSGYGNHADMQITRRDGVVTANFAITKVTPFSNNDGPGNFLPGFRPARPFKGAGMFWGTSAVPGLITISTAGVVTVFGDPGTNNNFSMSNMIFEHA